VVSSADSARGCIALTEARRLATWVGEGRRVTPKGFLRPADVPAAAEAMGISVPVKVRRATDVVALRRPWQIGLAVGFLQIVHGHARIGPTLTGWPDLDDDTVRERWLTGLALAYAAISPDTDEPVGATVARVVLAALAADPTASFTDLSRPVREALSSAHAEAAITYLRSWRTKTDPLAAAMDPLIDFGAAVHSRGRVTITPLGHWALETLRARAPRPISTDLTATELLARLTQIDEEEQWYAAQAWLASRAPLPASRDLLAAAATATPAQRIAAVELVHALGPRADAAWGEAAALPNLAAHVRLARDDLDEKAADWLAVEYAAAALPDHGPDEVLARLDDRFTGIGRDFRPEIVERTAHPAAAELTAAVTTFLASGTTPTSAQAYQLKISLDRMRPPVWRRVLLPATATLAELHAVIQVAMEWDENHLHAFTVGRRSYGDLNFDGDYDDEEQLRLTRAFASNSTISYRYDFGDCWDHSIQREHVLDLVDGATYPVCVAGRGDAPVEDWTDGPQSTPLDRDEINRRLARLDAATDPAD
jgi:hypothetical protein